MQFHRLAEPKLERECVVYNTSSCLSFDEVFLIYLEFSGGEKNGGQ
ncbi:hypothetical protein UT300018_32640 [Clostridium faecium]